MPERKINIPPLPLTGGCQCGAVRYSIKSAPVAFYVCHCTECQHQSASAFGESLQVNADDLEVTGETSLVSRQTATGRTMEGRFCPKCGSRIFHRIAGGSPFANVRAGTLDDTSWLVPAAHIWASSKQPWVVLPDDGFVFDQQPDVAMVRARWKEMTGA